MFEEIALIAVSSIGIIGSLLFVNLLKTNNEADISIP
jgi:hypothetical protein